MTFRPDIEGLRAVAVSIVLVAHAGLGFGSGGFVGVDVFFVISGFLITSLLVREVERHGTISLLGFYARRGRRILPAAAVVIVVVVVASAFLFTPVRREAVTADAIASSLYFVNWRFVAESVDYFGGETAQSPLQHYWSLAVEEQFYLLWPLLIIAATTWWAGRGRSTRTALIAVIGVLTGVSLAYSIGFTGTSGGEAYFSSFTRAWELGLGGLLAVLPAVRLSGRSSTLLASAGLMAILAATLLYDPSTRFPGSAALLPCLGAAAVIAAGTADRHLRLLALAPVRYAGRVSYCLYLWHWPALIFAAEARGELSPALGAAVVAASFIPAVLTHHMLERPILASRPIAMRPRFALALGLACTAGGLLASGAVNASQPEIKTLRTVKGAQAAERGRPPQQAAIALKPDPLEAGADKGRLEADGCLAKRDALKSEECAYGPPESKRNVVLFGDSHAMQYFPAIEGIAKRKGWRLTGLTKMGCPIADITVFNPALQAPYPQCDEWRAHALDRIEAIDDLDLVIVSSASFYSAVEGGRKITGERNNAMLEAAYASTLERLRKTGAKIVVLLDLPHAPFDVSECVSGELDSLSKCAFEKREAKNSDPHDIRAAASVPGINTIDPTKVICPDDVCWPVVGDALVYRGSNHLTATFAESLRQFMRAELPAID